MTKEIPLPESNPADDDTRSYADDSPYERIDSPPEEEVESHEEKSEHCPNSRDTHVVFKTSVNTEEISRLKSRKKINFQTSGKDFSVDFVSELDKINIPEPSWASKISDEQFIHHVSSLIKKPNLKS